MSVPTKLIALILSALLLTACGFHLRGSANMPFTSLYVDAGNPSTAFIRDLRRNIEANKVTLVDSPEQADAVLNIVFEKFDKQILSLGGGGRVTEFSLTFRVSLRAYDLEQQDLIPAVEMVIRRDYTFDDTKLLAKEAEEALLFKSMRADMVQQIVRRLGRAKLQPLPQPE